VRALCVCCVTELPNATRHRPQELHRSQQQPSLPPQPCQPPLFFCVLPSPNAALGCSHLQERRRCQVHHRHGSWGEKMTHGTDVVIFQVTMFFPFQQCPRRRLKWKWISLVILRFNFSEMNEGCRLYTQRTEQGAVVVYLNNNYICLHAFRVINGSSVVMAQHIMQNHSSLNCLPGKSD